MTSITAANAANELAAAERVTLAALLATSYVRLSIAAGFVIWAITASTVSGAAVLPLVVLVLGAALSYIHHRPAARSWIDWPFTAAIVGHLGSTGIRKLALNLPGVTEGIGALLAMTLVLGPFALPLNSSFPLGTSDLRTIGFALIALYTTFMWINFAFVSGWVGGSFKPKDQRRNWQSAVRFILPGLLCIAMATWGIIGHNSGNNLNVLAALMATLLPLSVYGVMWLYDTSAKVAAVVANEASEKQRQDSARLMHLLNPSLKEVVRVLEADSPSLGTALMNARQLRSSMTTIKLDLLEGLGREVAQDAASLVELAAASIPLLRNGEVKLTTSTSARDIIFQGQDWDVARWVLTDLLANAAVTASAVSVQITKNTGRRGSTICIIVEDDGSGFDDKAVLADPRSSLNALSVVLGREEGNGALFVDSRPGKTVVTATWHSMR